MDPKSLAKSKRSHGHQHRKKPHTSAASKPSTNLANVLPSNRDRYSDEEDDDLGADTVVAAKNSVGEVAPKSKGADFAWLIEQARSQPDEHRGLGSECSSSSNVIPVDFMQGMSSLLAFRGDSLLSLANDDNFIVDDDSASSFEVPFLSLDLHALASQLSKLKRSQRLFIEDDLLSDELDSYESEGSKASDQSARYKISQGQHYLDTPASLNHVYSKQDEFTPSVDSSLTSMDCKISQRAEVEIDQPQTSLLEATEPEPNKDLKPVGDFDVREAQDSFSQLNMHADKPNWSKSNSFEVTAAVTELDMLLDSFDGSNLSTSNGMLNKSFTAQAANTSSLNSMTPSSMKPDHSSLRHVLPKTSLDDALDNLLAETSVHLQGPQKDGAASSNNHSSRSSPGPRSMDDDFDSWLGTL
ncbi:hypothetical protein J5N97_004339 [Dioscorea zingiberensis]|uniref:Uncharacterized protein n=1 Tax=Dioscorea zingiberensis TaxID=325984 RepID=A0A9D5HRB1_9LILI|nr:hypothetical protein J5N97_004339 [Dioscorea zingiberensis]